MRLAIIADIHANFEALCAVMRDVSAQRPDALVCLGDVVGYGPDPGPCLDLVAGKVDAIVLGNHDEAALHPNIDDFFNESARESIRITRRLLDLPQRALLTALPERARIGEVSCSHATFGEERWDYLYGPEEGARSFAGLDARIGAVGHTHAPCVMTAPFGAHTEPERVRACRIEGNATVRIPEDCRVIVNPGSVGQPRDGNPCASWGLIDLKLSTFSIRRVPYDIDAVQRKIAMLGLPSVHGARLRQGA